MKTFFVVLMLAVSGCTRPTPPAEGAASCALDDGTVLEVSGRADGVYGVRGTRVDAEALIPRAELGLDESGIDPASGKKWLRFTVSEHAARRLEEFTSSPRDRSIAVVAGGQLASHHKIREPLKTNKVQISCCDPRACERLLKLF